MKYAVCHISPLEVSHTTQDYANYAIFGARTNVCAIALEAVAQSAIHLRGTNVCAIGSAVLFVIHLPRNECLRHCAECCA